jgi:hypothetical protein
MGPDPEKGMGDEDAGNPGRPVSSRLQVPGEPGHFRVRTRPPWYLSKRIYFATRGHVSCISKNLRYVINKLFTTRSI